MPLVVGRWSDRGHTSRYGRLPFLVGGSLLAACGVSAAAAGHGTSFLVLALAGTVAYVGVNVVTTAHRALVHDCLAGRLRGRRRSGSSTPAGCSGSMQAMRRWFATLIPRGEAGGYTALYYSLRAAACGLAMPLAGLAISVTGSYRALFLLGGTATLAALVPLALSPCPERGAGLTRALASG